MIKPVHVALAAMLAVPAYCAPAYATDLDWDWSMGSGNPTARTRPHRARMKYARRHHKSDDATKVMAFVKREEARRIYAPSVTSSHAPKKFAASALSGSAPKAPWTPPRRIGWSACATTTASCSST